MNHNKDDHLSYLVPLFTIPSFDLKTSGMTICDLRRCVGLMMSHGMCMNEEIKSNFIWLIIIRHVTKVGDGIKRD